MKSERQNFCLVGYRGRKNRPVVVDGDSAEDRERMWRCGLSVDCVPRSVGLELESVWEKGEA